MSGCFPSGQCTCKCHVSQSHHCENCCGKLDIQETLSLCKHKHPIKFSDCLKCLEEGAKIIAGMNKPKEEMITIKKSLWDEMLSYKKKIDMLEDLSCDAWDQLNKRIEKLEGYMEMEDRVTVSSVLLRLTEIERFQDITHEQYKKVISDSKPHKCPICEGKGNIKYQTTSPTPPYVLHNTDACNTCNETGIIWN